MTDAAFQLAEFNISRLKAPLDDPSMKGSSTSSILSTRSPNRAQDSSGGSPRLTAQRRRISRHRTKIK
jgi:hypothetical protein